MGSFARAIAAVGRVVMTVGVIAAMTGSTIAVAQETPRTAPPVDSRPPVSIDAARGTPSADSPVTGDASGQATPATPPASAPAEPPVPPIVEIPGQPAPAALTAAPNLGAREAMMGGAEQPHDLSPVTMFAGADRVVKAVMIALAIASLATWTVAFTKAIELWLAERRLRRTRRTVRAAVTLDAAVARDAASSGRGPAALMLRAALEERSLSEAALAHAGGDGLQKRVASALAAIEAHAARRIGKGLAILASVGSISPFIGLFGTVWGIMNAFIGIARTHTTSLAVVAPGIAEALMATALGLVAAIPAVALYNVFARAIGGYRLRLADVAAAIERLVSRDLDFRALPSEPARLHAVRRDAAAE